MWANERRKPSKEEEDEEEEETLPIFIPSDGFKEVKSDSSFLDMNVSVPAALSFLSSPLLRVQLFGPTPGRGNTNKSPSDPQRGFLISSSSSRWAPDVAASLSTSTTTERHQPVTATSSVWGKCASCFMSDAVSTWHHKKRKEKKEKKKGWLNLEVMQTTQTLETKWLKSVLLPRPSLLFFPFLFSFRQHYKDIQ